MAPKTVGLIFVLAAVVVEAFGQLSLKKGAVPGGINRWVATGIALYSLEIVLWTFALHDIDVNIAFPMSALCFVAVAVLSHFYLKENVSSKRWLGIVFIILGTSMVGSG
jgi:multidrug transporter EmrE-like cation transporter